MSFPISPADGSTTLVNGINYQYSAATNSWTRIVASLGNLTIAGNINADKVYTTQGLYWAGNNQLVVGSGINITTDSSPPSGPEVGDQWYDTVDDILFEYLSDGDSEQWVDITSASIAANSVINLSSGDFSILGHISPGLTSTYDLGNVSYQWRNLYVGGVSTLSNVSSALGYFWANGTPAFYSNTWPAQYLEHHTGNVTAGNVITTSGVFWSNGVSAIGPIYGNTQVATYLPNYTGNLTVGNVSATGIITATGNLTSANIITGVVTATGAITTASNITSANIITGNIVATGSITTTYTPASAVGAAIQLTGKDTQGGTGWFDFLKATNTTSGATNPNKSIRLNSTGGLEIINSAYSATLLTLTDAGAFSVASTVSSTGVYVNNKQAVNGPAFRAYIDGSQAITSGSQQKVTFGSETFDTNSNFASSTFTPTVEGYYQLNATVRIAGPSGTGEIMITIWKNGSEYARGTNEGGTEQGASWYSMQVSDIAYANGTTDYFEIYIQQTSGSNKDTTAGTNISYFSGVMVRGA